MFSNMLFIFQETRSKASRQGSVASKKSGKSPSRGSKSEVGGGFVWEYHFLLQCQCTFHMHSKRIPWDLTGDMGGTVVCAELPPLDMPDTGPVFES